MTPDDVSRAEPCVACSERLSLDHERLIGLMGASFMGIEEISGSTGTSRDHMRLIVSGAVGVSEHTARLLAEALDCEITDICPSCSKGSTWKS